MDIALLLLRLIVGLLLAGHGAQKLFGWFGGNGLKGFTGWLTSMGFHPAQGWALLAGICEFGGGLLFTLGLFSPLGSLAIGASMVMAISRVHWPKIWVSEGGIELALINLTVVAAVGIAGPGGISLDGALSTSLPATIALIGVVVVLVVWIVGHVNSSARQAQKAKPS
jgi:putative oxidoreductase